MTNELDKAAEQQMREAQREYYAAQRMVRLTKARDDLLEFTHMTMPDPADPDNPDASAYEPAKVHKAIAAALEEIEAGRLKRLILNVPPRHGKSELCSRRFPAWVMGRHPNCQLIQATYSGEFAKDFGRDVRAIIKSPAFRQIFPHFEFRKGGQAANRFETIHGGKAAFVGRGEALTGRGGEILILDDPFKDADEADSPAIRNAAWQWFTKVFMTRRQASAGIIVIMCMTGDTPVLMADGREKPLRDVRPGDEVATYENGALTTATVRNWANQGPDRVFRIKMASGASVRANARHPFLVETEGGTEWRRTDTLRKGDRILRAIGESGAMSNVWKTDAPSRWSARAGARRTTVKSGGQTGIVRRPTIRSPVAALVSKVGTALRKTSIFGSWMSKMAFARFAGSLLPTMFAPIGAGSCASTTAMTPNGSGVCFATTATSPSDTGKRRKSSKPLPSTYAVTSDEVESVEESGVEDVFDIQVDRTENFIANGLVSHNTRWHEDDIVGRLTDPGNPHYNAEEARSWKQIVLPAEAETKDPMGREQGEALWPERFDKTFLDSQKRLDPRGYSALYQQRPSPEEGDLITTDMIQTYTRSELPPIDDMRIYATSDHATTKDQRNDPNCITIFGVDNNNVIWVLDNFWKHVETNEMVEEMLTKMKAWDPLTWWTGRDHITKSIGPFLYQRMKEEHVYIRLEPIPEIHDKVRKAKAIIARMAMGMVKFPADAPWFEKARSEMLKFPNGRHDDFVDTLAFLGRGLPRLVGPGAREAEKKQPEVGTLAWVKMAGRQAERDQAVDKAIGDM